MLWSFVAAIGIPFVKSDQTSGAQVAPTAISGFRPKRYPKDDWLDEVPGDNRFFIDATDSNSLGRAISFAVNYLRVNKNEYGLEPTQLAVVVCLRHIATAFAFNEAMWKKYGFGLAEHAQFVDPRTKVAPTVNIFNVSGYAAILPNYGVTLDYLSTQGVRFAVCQTAAGACAGAIARHTGGDGSAIYGELVANTVDGARLVPAGVVALARAQERGYSFLSAGS
jgi:intracellular sulfur oxidation DsrE/DsrF family protein